MAPKSGIVCIIYGFNPRSHPQAARDLFLHVMGRALSLVSNKQLASCTCALFAPRQRGVCISIAVFGFPRAISKLRQRFSTTTPGGYLVPASDESRCARYTYISGCLIFAFSYFILKILLFS